MTQEQLHQLHIAGPESSQTVMLPIGVTTIGRQAGNSLVLDHFLVSRRHAELQCTVDECAVKDLNSANGVVIDGQKLSPGVSAPLGSGTVFQIGPYNITYTFLAAKTPQPEPEPIETPLPPPIPEITVQPEVVIEPAIVVDEVQPTPPVEPEPEVSQSVVKPGKPETEPPQPEEVAPPLDKPSLPPVPPVVTAPPPPPPPAVNGAKRPLPDLPLPPGLSPEHSRYLEYLPGIYHSPFMSRFLAIFESILTPIEWNVDNFDLYLAPDTAPHDFLHWLANWFEIVFDDSWSNAQRRTILTEAHEIYARRGTKWALSRVLEIYTGVAPQIDDESKSLEAFTFVITIPRSKRGLNVHMIESIIDAHKPAHTNYVLKYSP